jgi:hypothetical protein
MADIDQILAGGAGASSRADFSGIARLPELYFKGRDEFAKNDLRDAFRGGVPTLPDGSPDYASMQKVLYQKGGLEQGNALGVMGARAGELAALDKADGPTQPIVGPSTSRNPVAIDPTKRPDISAGPQAQPAQQPTVMTVLAQHVPNDQLEAASASVARQLGVNPTDPIDTNDPKIRNVLVPAVQQIKRMGLGQVQPPQPGDNPPQPQVAQAAPQSFQPSPTQAAAQNDPVLKRLTLLAASQDKQIAAAAKVRLEAYLKDKESTTEMKNAAASGQTLPQYQEKQGELAAQQAGATERAKADVKEQQEYIDAGKAASQRLTTLNSIVNVASTDKNVSFGFGADTELKVKMALERLGFNFGDLSGSQLIQKMNASLASEMAKSLTGRPTQFEFKTFLANNPGLLLDKTGTLRLASIFSQLSKREYDLGKLARQNGDNWQKWDDIVEKYDAEKAHQIVDPVSKKPIYTNSIVAPGDGQTSSGSTLPKFSSPADVHAAIKAKTLKSGDPFLTSDGKTKYAP